MKTPDFLVVGAGIFGTTTAIALRQKGYSVVLIEAGPIPNPLAASTDISKVVRMEYGSDREYMDMVESAIEGWRGWNDLFRDTLYHEVGFLMLARKPFDAGENAFEAASYENLLRKGYRPERLNSETLKNRFPAFNAENYADAIFNPIAGYAESGRTVRQLADYAESLGVEVIPFQTAENFETEGNRVIALYTREGRRFVAGEYVVCTGPHTPWLVPELKPCMRITGHPVFHIKPSRPELFTPPHFSVFTADISNTGWYGFPLHPREGVVKIGNHGIGVELHPEHDERVVYPEDEAALRAFLQHTFPDLAADPVVYTRRCLYDDTLDGHFWIDRHSGLQNLSIGTGGSGHGLKMGPVIGEMIAAVAEGGQHRWSARYRRRALSQDTRQEEEARFKSGEG